MLRLEKSREARWRTLDELAASMEPGMRRTFIKAIEELREAVPLALLVTLVKAGLIEEIMQRYLASDALIAVRDVIRDAIVKAAKEEAASVPEMIKLGMRPDVFGTFSAETVRNESASLIQQLAIEQRKAIQTLIIEGAQNSRPTAAVAADIKQFIGLTEPQVRAALRYRKELETGDLNSLKRTLRDATSDNRILTGVREGRSLPSDFVSLRVDRYVENSLAARAVTISETESVRAVSAGARMLWRQAQIEGRVGELQRNWFTATSEACPVCKAIPRLNPNGVGMDEYFVTDLGPIFDTPVHPKCRCSVMIRPRLIRSAAFF